MEILGKITNSKNIELLNYSLEEEMKFNNPLIGYEWVANRYKENFEKYGKYLYEAEKIKFIDTDVFRQAAIHYKKYGVYTLLDPDEDTAAYNAFWDREEYRRKHGMTAWCRIDANGNYGLVYITGELYGYLNYCPMLKTKDKADDVIQEEVGYVTKLGIDKLVNFFNQFKTTNVTSKDVGLPLFFDGQYHISIARSFARFVGLNFFYGKARRKGQSYWNGWCGFNNADLNPNTTTIQAAYDLDYLTEGDGLSIMSKNCSNHINLSTDWAKNRLIDTKTNVKFGYKYEGEKEERGFRSQWIAKSTMNNPDVTVGKDAWEVQYEELGKFPNFDDSFGVTTSTSEAGDAKTGFITGWGTGGTKDANWAAFEKVCYNPEAYGALACNNIWDEGAEGTPCSYFYPHVQSLEGHMDEYGNTNYESAWMSFIKAKEHQRQISTDATSFMRWCGQRANSPAEAFARSGENIFPTELIAMQLAFVQNNKKVKHAMRCGTVMAKDGRVVFVTNEELASMGIPAHPPITDFPLTKNTDVHGCVVEFQPPYIDPTTGLVPEGLYVAWQDPYAHDKDAKKITTRDSLGATYIYERPNNITPSRGGICVASWVGRPPLMDTYNNTTLLLLMKYRAKMLFENDRGDVIPFFRKHKATHFLFEEPAMLFNKQVQGKIGRGWGMHMTEERKGTGAIYLRDMLLTEVGKSDDGVTPIYLLNYIFDEAFLKELIKWSNKGNFDRVSSWIVGQFIIKEVEQQSIKLPNVHNKNSLFNRDLF